MVTVADTWTLVGSELIRFTTRPPVGATESRPIVASPRCMPTPTKPTLITVIAGWLTVTVLEEPLLSPPALVLIWYWPAAVGLSTVTNGELYVVEVLAAIVRASEGAG